MAIFSFPENRDVSFTNNFGLGVSLSDKSLMYITKNNGLSIDPRGTPALVTALEEYCQIRVTSCFLLYEDLSLHSVNALGTSVQNFQLRVRSSSVALTKGKSALY